MLLLFFFFSFLYLCTRGFRNELGTNELFCSERRHIYLIAFRFVSCLFELSVRMGYLLHFQFFSCVEDGADKEEFSAFSYYISRIFLSFRQRFFRSILNKVMSNVR